MKVKTYLNVLSDNKFSKCIKFTQVNKEHQVAINHSEQHALIIQDRLGSPKMIEICYRTACAMSLHELARLATGFDCELIMI